MSPSPWARNLWSRDDWLVLDTETTGLGEEREPVEIAVVDAAGDVALHTLVRPGQRPTREARGLHGLDLLDLRDAPTFPALHSRLHGLLTGRPVVTYGATFDRRTLELACRRHRLPMPRANWHCLLIRHQQWRGYRTSLRIACEIARLPLPDTSHRALPDTHLARQLLAVMAGAPP